MLALTLLPNFIVWIRVRKLAAAARQIVCCEGNGYTLDMSILNVGKIMLSSYALDMSILNAS